MASYLERIKFNPFTFTFPSVGTFFRETFLCKDGGGTDADGYCSQQHSHKELALKYLPVALILFFFWPVFVTMIITVISASSWVFWLFTSLCVGIVQMLYVIYQFFMIFTDLLMISGLKTFATLRSQVRYYTIKTGLSKKRKGHSRRGRRKEWKNKLDGAETYKEYREIGIDEGEPTKQQSQRQGSGGGGGGGDEGSSLKKKGGWNVSFRGLRKNTTEADEDQNGSAASASVRPPLGPRLASANSKARRMRKSQSCVDIDTLADSRAKFNRVKSSENFNRSNSAEHDAQDGKGSGVESELKMAGGMLITTTARLREARSQASSPSPRSPTSSPRRKNSSDGHNGPHTDGEQEVGETDGAASLKFLLTGVVKRNHLSVDDVLIEDAQSVAECGRHYYSAEARDIILGYNDELEKCLDWIAESPVQLGDVSTPRGGGEQQTVTAVKNGEWSGTVDLGESPMAAVTAPGGGGPDEASTVMRRQGTELSDRISLLRKLKQNMGRSALMLSGGGAQAMYHLGTVRALVESGLYDSIKVISGTSGGSITAAMCALKTPTELFEDVCVAHVSTDFGLDGRMKRENIRWFPKLVDMIPYWLQHKLLVDSAEFKRCCDFYYGDVTFAEAFQRTGKHVCITVSASRATGAGGKAQRLLLNHISTPHVTLASAVACSCALPGVMAPAKLVTKDTQRKQENFEVDGVEWIDGSVQADLPFKRISTLFNVSNFIVCQTNFHVVPLLRKAHHPGEHSLYWRAFQACEWDIRGRVLALSRLGLFPKLFGHDISKVFKQKYHGNITLVPRFTTMQLFGLKALVNPTVEDMVVYLKNGQIAAWPYLSVMKEMLRVETKIDRCLARLESRLDDLVPDHHDMLMMHGHDDNDDVESISSSYAPSVSNRMRFLSSHRENELLRAKVGTLERENGVLRGQVEQLQRAMGIVHASNSGGGSGGVASPVREGIQVSASLSFNLSEDGDGDAACEAKVDSGGEKGLGVTQRTKKNS